MRSSLKVRVTLRRLLLLVLVLASPLRAAETDPYYGWWVPPHDGTRALDDAINRLLTASIDDENARGDRASHRCEDVALHLEGRLAPTAGWFFLGLTRSWDVDVSPRSSREYVEEFGPLSVYTPARLFPFGKFVPVDPSVRVDDIVFGTDKIAHFFTNGARYYRRFLEEKAAGRSDDDAVDAAIAIGVGEEAGVLGQWASGIFSFADLQANLRGLFWYRSLCEGAAPKGILGIDVHGPSRAAGQQRCHNVSMAIQAGPVQGAVAILVGAVSCAPPQQSSCHLQVPIGCCLVQGSVAPSITEVDVAAQL